MALAWCVDEDLTFVGAGFHIVIISCFLQPRESMQFFFSASLKIDIIGKPHVAKRSSCEGHWRKWSVNDFCVIFSKNILNSNGEDGHPCHTPTVTQKKSPPFQFSNIALVASMHNDPMTSIGRLSVLYSFKIRQKSHHSRHDGTLSWSRLSYGRAPGNVMCCLFKRNAYFHAIVDVRLRRH